MYISVLRNINVVDGLIRIQLTPMWLSGRCDLGGEILMKSMVSLLITLLSKREYSRYLTSRDGFNCAFLGGQYHSLSCLKLHIDD